jgi:glycosyltransferase involved in cell wall biosynthesis
MQPLQPGALPCAPINPGVLRNIVFAVTTDLSYDQRMLRVCRSLAAAGFGVTLIGRLLPSSIPLSTEPYRQHRMKCIFNRGKLFYLEFQCRLLLRLLRERMDVVCAVDLDTALPCYVVSRLRRKPRVMDAHELFSEMKEVVSRPLIRSAWKAIESFVIPRFPRGYTVSAQIARHFREEYGVDYALVRNMSLLREPVTGVSKGDYIIYQGSVNEGRCFEWLLPAMGKVETPLHIYGDGNLLEEVRERIAALGIGEKAILMGKRSPDELRGITATALVGVNLVEDCGLSNRYSLANRFFDYVQAGVPQICSDLPAYRELNEMFRVAVLVDGSDPDGIASALNNLLGDGVLTAELRNNCRMAARVWNWQSEEVTLLGFYRNL